MARSKSRDAILNEIEALQKKLKAHDKAEAERIGNIALKAGLGSVNISDEALTKAFEDLVKRFREGNPDLAEPKAKGRRGAGQAQESSGETAA
ncbi:TraC family protein [Methylobacterium sp. CCH5-D2]|uniref:TraC family protein n=1 Tax=Methylobacterium sp. CCH5-D2 TaxID=1768765 RepID=UPI0008296BC4|nr:TraC family protein [Methylobacterium sp. CCH5-D2]